MPEKTVTIHYEDDGTIRIDKFVDDPHLSKVKQLVDGLRGSVEDLKPKAAKVAEIEKIGSLDDIATWKKTAEEATALRDRITELEGKVMTDEERRQYDELKAKAEKFGDLDPEKAREAIAYRERAEKERSLSEAFEAVGMNPKAALRLDGVRDLETRVDTETRDGKAVKVAKVKVGQEWRPLDEHVQSEYADFVPVLKPTANDKADNGRAPIDGVRNGGSPKGEPASLGDAINQHYSQK